MPHVSECVTDGPKVQPSHWYAFRLRSNRERTVERDLIRAGVPVFLPLYTVETRWSDRVKTAERPLFPGYIFAQVSDVEPVIHTRGIVGALPSNYSPAAIDAGDIDLIRRIVTQTASTVEPCTYQPGQNVRVETGSFAGARGVVQRTKSGRRLVVTLQLIARSVAVELDADTVTIDEKTTDQKATKAA
jgi:transcription antitermination factor NusG